MNDDDPRHGTTNGYSNLGCRCSLCRRAWADYNYELKLRRASGGKRKQGRRQEFVVPHGTPGGYGNYSCRCRECTDAWARDSIERYRRRRDAKMGEARLSPGLTRS